MLDLCDRIAVRGSELDRETSEADEDLRLTPTHLIQTLSEAARKASSSSQERYPEIQWAEITGMRSQIVRDYLDVDYDLVWDVATTKVPALRALLEPILPSADQLSEGPG
ncbi:MAG: DUF86 domain-containing protein [Holophagales bacterium]|nr:MAG: DUF86 domain-containing protein [Holophagales bacterium]